MPIKSMQTDTNDVYLALQGIKIKDAEDSELSNKLGIVYWMIGLRPQHFPTKEQDSYFFNYLRKNFPNKTTNEIVIAFDKAINGKLDIEDVKCYDQFTLEYFCRIFNAYRKWSSNLFKELPNKETKQIENMPEVTEKEMKEDIEYFRNKVVNERLSINFIPTYLYDYCEKLKLIKLSKLEKFALIDKAKQFKKDQLKLKASSFNKDDIAEYNSFCHLLEKGFIKDSLEMNNIINLAKKIAFIDYAKKYNNTTTEI